MTLTFAELQTKMQIAKSKKQGINYSFRNAEEIFTHFKSLNSEWVLIVSDELVELAGRIFIKATATATKKDEVRQATRYAELDSVPVFKTGNAQMQVPQWTGAVSSYAGKYALQGLFGIGEEDVDALEVETAKKQQTSQSKKEKIAPALVTGYKQAIQNVIDKTGKNDGSITKWFLKHLNVTMIENITTDQVDKANQLIEKLQGAKKIND
ncbi:hypothetical protein B7930_03040 [Streptococcus agalactiae]|uniref:ERF family protein n=1 Tax=Streptococcus agalactiae TaxID=1311 RepID=UPI000B673C32|nr:ERF family protein [Streptococcus agalactiae]OTG59127.1 hypothetical protein B7930_03040 [Streptococcus agalactiae]RRA75502.1 single-stranded DNA-binding protein [Streptococcus agalactiae]